jgi:hypothetical protein
VITMLRERSSERLDRFDSRLQALETLMKE